jgi:hypothetical protein
MAIRSLLDSGPLAMIQVEVKKPELQPLNLNPPNLLQWSSEESGFMEWSDSQRTLNDSSSVLNKRFVIKKINKLNQILAVCHYLINQRICCNQIFKCHYGYESITS